MVRRVPKLTSDEEAEAFLAQDLSDLDFSQFKRVNLFEFAPKSAQLNMRVPQELLEAIKLRAKARGIPYTRLVREAMELVVAAPRRKAVAGKKSLKLILKRSRRKSVARKRGVKRSRRVA